MAVKSDLSVLCLLLACAALGCSGAKIQPIDTTAGAAVTNPESLFGATLEDYVAGGRVDYRGLCDDDRLAQYIGYLARTDPAGIESENARLAFWINAYNAYTLKVICDNYPVESINDLHFGGLAVGTVTRKTIWHKEFAVIGGETYSLNHIEHEIIRPVYDDPRAHFALVCAAKSCPPLRSEAYTGGRLDEQLDDQGRVFFADAEKNRFDAASKTAHLSKILDWYAGDFGDGREELLSFIARYLPPDIRDGILEAPADWRVKHTHYDWSLNE
jgi:hypothetical protein